MSTMYHMMGYPDRHHLLKASLSAEFVVASKILHHAQRCFELRAAASGGSRYDR